MKERAAFFIAMVVALALPAFAAPGASESGAVDKVVDRIVAREAENLKMYQAYSPLVETYVQTYSADKDLGRVPNDDHYFLGRVSFKGHIQDTNFLDGDNMGITQKVLHQFTEFALRHHTGWVPMGFAQMAVIDDNGFDRNHYNFVFERREFLGEIRCFVFDVMPKAHEGKGRFLGRIWVEDEGYNIVRFNGTYVRPKEHSSFVHFDSWRINVASGKWVPAYIYGEESAVRINGRKVGFRSQTRLWGYAQSQQAQNEFTAVIVDSKDAVDQTGRAGLSPLGSERSWERQAEDNVVGRLERSGLLAPESGVDKVLDTVVNNLLVTNNLSIDPDVRCRVLLTAPAESFTIGHTIVISRGLLDVLPDEASLAMVLARQLGEIVMGYGIDTKFGFSDRLLFPDSDLLDRLAMQRNAGEEAAADKEAVELLGNSPYKDKLANAGLFLKQIAQVRSVLPNFVRGTMGNSFLDNINGTLAPVVTSAPALKPLSVTQIAALPLGARISVEPWSGRAEMSKAPAAAILTARDKMAFQITPFYPYLYRVDAGPQSVAAAGNAGGN